MMLRAILIPVVVLGVLSLFAFFRTPSVLGAIGLLALTGAVTLRQEKTRHSDTAQEVKDARIRALIIGAGEVGQTLAAHLEASGRYQVIGFVDDQLDPIEASEIENEKLLGTRRDTALLVKQYAIGEVFVAYAPTWQQRLAEQLAMESPDVSIRVVPSPYESMMHVGGVEHLGDIALVRLQTTPGRFTEVTKRTFDIVMALFGLTVTSPFLLVCGVLVRLTSRGPVIFAQERIGRYGKPFLVYKFRTMHHNAEQATGPVLATGKNDSRLTGVGRWLRLFRIDEIPQLWNVLRGEMSLVGPRPERPVFVEEFERQIPTYSKRHQVRPGITGLAQVYGGYHTDARDKLRFDLIYISHQSLWYDLTILFRTIQVVVFPKH